MSEMYLLYNKIKIDHNIRQSSSLWLNLVDVKQLWEDASMRNERCGSHPFRCGFYTAYMTACVCRRGGHYHQLFYNVNLLFNFFFFTIRRKDFILGRVKYVPQTRATFYSFSCEGKYNMIYLYDGSVQTNFSPTLIYLAQLPNSKFIQMSLWVRSS